MLITILVVIAILLALILFTIAAANPDAFWNGVGVILIISVIVGVVVGGCYGVWWMLTLDWSDPGGVAGTILRPVTSVLGSIFMIGAALFWGIWIIWWARTYYKEIVVLLIFLPLSVWGAFGTYFGISHLVALTRVDETFANFSSLIGAISILPTLLVIWWLGKQFATLLKIPPLSRDIATTDKAD